MPIGVEAEVEIARVGAQGGEQEAGAKDASTSGGRPEAVKETACAVPETSVAEIGLETEAPRVTAWLPPLLREKSKATAPLPNS